jgi:hypothetical protein
VKYKIVKIGRAPRVVHYCHIPMSVSTSFMSIQHDGTSMESKLKRIALKEHISIMVQPNFIAWLPSLCRRGKSNPVHEQHAAALCFGGLALQEHRMEAI